MSIDERLENLAQQVELLTALHGDNERFITQKFAELADSMKRLANVAVAHEDRLDEHQERLDKGGL